MKPKLIRHLQAWAVNNSHWCIFIGISIIASGLMVDLLDEKKVSELLHIREAIISILIFIIAHGLIILGEVIAVTFFLHLFIEEKQHEQNAKMVEELGNESKRILTKQAGSINDEFKGLIDGFKVEADRVIADINEGLFVAILKDKLPHQIVKPLLDSNFFIAEILRRSLTLTFSIKEINEDKLKFLQRTEFDIEYVFGANQEYLYNMPISLSNTPIVEYKLKEVGYRRYVPGDTEWKKFRPNNGIDQAEDDFTLMDAVKIQKNQKIKVFQEVDVICKIGGVGIFDNYCSFHHTVGMRIDILDLPDDYEFKLYPTFDSDKFKNPSITGMKISYKHIEFLVAGQGIGFSISKKL
jgi:hypothetical protein